MSQIRNRVCAVLLLLFSLQAHSAAFDHQHKLWNEVLALHVVDFGTHSQIDYAPLKASPEKLDSYLDAVSTVTREQFDQWDAKQRLAFLINAYNAYTVQMIIRHYPVDSIKDIGSFFRSVWKINFFELFGKSANLDYIEHELIRGANDFSEARIHFALVCASIGCPKLQATAYTKSNLERLLDDSARRFINDTSRNCFDESSGTLKISSLFKWYHEDFERVYGSVEAFIAKYMSADKKLSSLIETKSIEIEYGRYDWSLNDVQKENHAQQSMQYEICELA